MLVSIVNLTMLHELHFICVFSGISAINSNNVACQENYLVRSVSLWTHLEFDKCDLENSVFDIFDIDSFAFFVCSICDSVYALYTCKHCSKVVQCLVKGACVCGWRLFMYLYALIQMQRGLSIIVISLLETFMFFLPIFLSFQIILHFIFLRSRICMCYMMYLVLLPWFPIVHLRAFTLSITLTTSFNFNFQYLLSWSEFICSVTYIYVLLSAL